MGALFSLFFVCVVLFVYVIVFRLCHPERSQNPSATRIKRCMASFGISDGKVRFFLFVYVILSVVEIRVQRGSNGAWHRLGSQTKKIWFFLFVYVILSVVEIRGNEDQTVHGIVWDLRRKKFGSSFFASRSRLRVARRFSVCAVLNAGEKVRFRSAPLRMTWGVAMVCFAPLRMTLREQ